MRPREIYLVDDNELVSLAGKGKPGIETGRESEPPPRRERAFRYGRMFKKSGISIEISILRDLGKAMHALPQEETGDSTLPSGYTYLGQFITHDITFDRTEPVPDGELSAEDIRQGRTPSLELDSLYGMGPLSESSRHLYESDRLKFKIGRTTPTRLGNATEVLPNDLPRNSARTALIADSRNDRNLALAQTHLAFLKFHNAVIDKLRKEGEHLGRELFDAARKTVIQHYQSVILHDYLPRIVDPAVLEMVMQTNAAYFSAITEKERFLPVEFAFAAFRFGHSMVRDAYQWNRIFESQGSAPPELDLKKRRFPDAARLAELFLLTGGNGNLQGAPSLPSNWVIDWNRFFDFPDAPEDLKSNRARKIDTRLAAGMMGVPGMPAGVAVEKGSVAVLDLMMSAVLSLPSGQEVFAVLQAKNPNVFEGVSLKQIAQQPHAEFFDKYSGLSENTPLWYYILKEAEVTQNGECLGPVGSWIVAETILGLLYASEFSILQDSSWKPSLKSKDASCFKMTDLLLIAGDLNPLN